MNFVDWVENTTLGLWMADSLWAYPLVLATHAVGMSIVVGTIVMIDLRVLGFAKGVPLRIFDKIMLVCWIGVVLNLLSGVALFTVDPEHFLFHPVFWAKIGLVIAGMFFVYLLLGELKKCAQNGQDSPELSHRARLIATLSLLFWLGAIIAGRLIAYIESGWRL